MNLTTTLLAFFLLPLLAGGVVHRIEPNERWLRLLLSFSGAFLLGVAVLHMLPELYEEGGAGVGLWLLGGFLLQTVLEFFSHGIEHGHMHGHPQKAVPLMMVTSLCTHSFVEGLPFADARVSGDLPFLLGVLLHKAPMAIALAAVLWRSNTDGARRWGILTTFAAAAPLGILTGTWIGADVGTAVLQHALAVAIGMLLHISTTIIFESAPDHRFHLARFAAVMAGAGLSITSMH
jgi:zinc transporter ZupT